MRRVHVNLHIVSAWVEFLLLIVFLIRLKYCRSWNNGICIAGVGLMFEFFFLSSEYPSDTIPKLATERCCDES